jgi:ESCRT-II complex subunit VPS22
MKKSRQAAKGGRGSLNFGRCGIGRSRLILISISMHRLGGAGLAALHRQQESLKSFDALSSQLSTTQVENLHAQLDQFRAALTHFATHHRADIRGDPRFRRAFQQMCASIGVDPLAGPRRGGWWEEALGLGDWQSELGVQIVDVCVSTRERNGGLIELAELVRILSRLRGLEGGGGGAITEEDVIRSIQALKALGAGYEVLEFGHGYGGRKMVRSVPKELDADQMVVLAVAAEQGGKVDEELLIRRNAWNADRARAVLQNMLLNDGTCWLDDQDGPDGMGRAYWIPAAMQWDD